MEELYNQLYKDGKYTKTFEDFQTQFGTPEKSEKLYNALNQNGDYTKSFDDFKLQFNVVGKTEDSAIADPNAESAEDMGSKSEENLSAWQSVKNSFSNLAEQFGDIKEYWTEEEGARSSMDIATNSVAAALFGQDKVDAFVKENKDNEWLVKGIGSESTMDALEAYKKEKEETKDTLGIIESVKKGDIGGALAGAVNAVTSMIGSVAYGAGTLGTGFFMDYVAENYVEFNKLKAENLGVSFDELVLQGEADNAIPIGMGTLSTALEFIGLGTIAKGAKGAFKTSGSTGLLGSASKYLAEKVIYDKGARATMKILSTGTTEFTTEILQHAADQVNLELGSVAGTEKESEVFKTIIDAVTSQEGLEAGLQGFIGGGGMVAGSYSAKSMNTIRNVVDGDKIYNNINELSDLRKQYNLSKDKSVKEGIQIEINKKESNIADSVVKGNEIYNSLDNEQISKIESLTDLADAAAYKITELNKKLRRGDISNAEYEAASSGFKAEYDAVRQSLIDMELEKNIASAETIASEKGLNIDVKSSKEVEDLMNSDKVSEENKKAYFDNKNKGFEVSAFVIGNDIVIDRDIARKTGSINAGMHEVLHPILNKLVGDAKKQGKIVNQFRKAMTSSQRRFVDAEMKARGYTGNKYNTEYVNVFSDALRKKQINYDKTLFEKIGDAIVGVFKPIGYTNIGFESGKDVYNFIKEFDQSAEQGKLTTKAAEALKDVDLTDAGLEELQTSKTLSQDVETDLTSKILEAKKLAKENEEIAKKYGKEPIPGAKQIRLENEIRQGVQPIIEKVIANRTKALYDPIAPDQKRNVSRQEFQDSMRSDIETMILKEFKEGGNTLEKFIVDRSYLRANDLAKRLGIEEKIKTSLSETDSEGKPTVQIADDYDYGTTIKEIRAEEGRQKRLINPLDILGKELSKEYTDTVEAEVQNITPEKLAELSFSKIKDLAPEVTAKFWGTTLRKVTDAKANLATSEIAPMQAIILGNIDKFIKLLPNGAVLEGDAASERLRNTGLGIPRKLQQVFYDKGERTSKGSGLIPFTLKNNITKTDFAKAFGINEDGTFEKFGGKDPRAQTILAFIRLFGQLNSNTAIRQLADLTDQQKADIKAGAAAIQFSMQATPVSNKYKLDKASRLKLFDLMIEGGFNNNDVNKFLEKNNVAEKDIETIKEELTHEGILEYMQDLKAANNGFKYEAALKDVLNKLGKDFKVDYIKGKKGDLTITGPNKLNIKIEVKLNENAQIGSASIGLFKTDNGKIVLTNFEDIKTSIGISKENKNRLITNIRANEGYINNLLDIINKINESSDKKITVSRTGHLKLPQNVTIDGKTFDSSGDVWSLIKEKNGNKAGYFNYISDQSIVQDFYKGIDLIEIGNYGMYAIGEDSKMKSGYSMLKAKMNNVVRPAKSGSTLYFRLFPNFSQIENVKENSLSTKKGIEKISNEVLQSDNAIQLSKTAKETTDTKLNTEFNNIIENVTGIKSFKRFSEAKGKVRGQKKGRFSFFIPPSADDFSGLLYKLTGKGKVGEQQQKWFKENLFDPFAKGMRDFESFKQDSMLALRVLKKEIKNVPAGLKKVNETGFTNEQAVRVYLWVLNDVDIPGLSETDKKNLVAIVQNNDKLNNFAKSLNATLDGYSEPDGNWLSGTITTDVLDMVNTLKRAEFLQEWQANVDTIFSKENKNKLRAAFGDNYVEALEDILYRMKAGRNRPMGSNKLTNKFMNWVNDSVGTIMFFNTRSALLQTLSTVNFINWGDNNPMEAAKAFSNQKQFWQDFADLFNSDFLKQRRSGLKTDVNADDIANAAETSTNKVKAALSAVLKMGFLPTQMADSFAIALGGASFIRNRTNSYIKEGMSKTDAYQKAFLDFQEIAEETQQSSRPDRISQQQASPLGRVILAFANTPMQYMRLTKKAFLDLKNGRGDAKTNITKIAYYMFVQNVIFSALQSALFAALFDDDEELDEKEVRIANSMLDSVLRGLGVYGAAASTIKNVVIEIKNQSEKDRPDYTVAAQRALTLSPPVDSKMRKLMSAGRAFSYKTTREKMKGFGLDNPAYYAVGQVVSATTNVPLDRVVKKAENIKIALDNDTKYWQSLALLLGYSKWDLGIVEPKESKKGKKRTTKRKFGAISKWKGSLKGKRNKNYKR